jgi:type II secretory pathway pseudopilin PulG
MARTDQLAARTSCGPRPAVSGFTALELVVVMTIVLILTALIAPGIYPAIAKGRVHEAANAIMSVAATARRMALSTTPGISTTGAATNYYGVAVVSPTSGGPAYAVLLYGNSTPSTPTDSSSILSGALMADIPTQYRQQRIFNINVMPFSGSGTSLPATVTLVSGGVIAWYYQYRTGAVLYPASSSNLVPMNIGVIVTAATPPTDMGPTGVPLSGSTIGVTDPVFGVSTLDQRFKTAIAVYSVGLMNTQDL